MVHTGFYCGKKRKEALFINKYTFLYLDTHIVSEWQHSIIPPPLHTNATPFSPIIISSILLFVYPFSFSYPSLPSALLPSILHHFSRTALFPISLFSHFPSVAGAIIFNMTAFLFYKSRGFGFVWPSLSCYGASYTSTEIVTRRKEFLRLWWSAEIFSDFSVWTKVVAKQ